MATADPSSQTHLRGYPKEIFSSQTFDEKFLCNLCNFVLREPVQAFCGHRFCNSCIQANIDSNEDIQCTQCRKEDNLPEDMSIIDKNQIFPDNAIKREMSRLNVKCANSGCSWKGTFKQYEGHFNECSYQRVKCSNCGQEISKAHMEEHLDNSCYAACPKCQTRVLYNLLQLHIEEECLKAPLTCDKCGKQGIIREQIESHQRSGDCRSHPIQCPVGCGMIERKDFHDHFHAKKHNVWMVNAVEEIQRKTSELQATPGRINEMGDQFGRKLVEVNDRIGVLQQQIGEIVSRQSEIGNGTGAQGAGNIDQKIRQITELQLQTVNERLDVKTGTFEGIASALHRELEKTITGVEKLDRHRQETEKQLEQLQNKVRSLERSQALKDMTIAELELKSQSMEAASFDGTFMWKVSDFSKKHQDALHGRTISIYSPPFYTTRRGYKMCARLYPNGDGMGKGSHLSLFFVVMRGNYDALLKWPFSQRVSFCLINQTGGEHVIDSFRPDPQSSSFKRPTSDMNIASGCPLFIRQEMLQNSNHGFLKDDTLFLKIAVDTTELTDPVSNLEDRIKPAALA